MSNPYNPKIKDVPAAFDNVDKNGHLHEFHGEPWVPDMVESHVQGIARYGDYYYLTHNNKGYSKGFLLVLDNTTQKMILKLDTPKENYNHPGGIQVIGDYLAVSLENSDHNSSFVLFYSLKDPRNPELMSLEIARSDKGCGTVGITNFTRHGTEYYLVAAYDNGKTDFYESNGQPLADAGLQFTKVSSCDFKNTGFAEMCLVTQQDNKVYCIGFWVDGTIVFDDYCTLLLYDRDQHSVDKLKERHMYTTHGGVKGLAGVHFRYGSGLRITSDTSMDFYATQRNFVAGLFYLNKFKP